MRHTFLSFILFFAVCFSPLFVACNMFSHESVAIETVKDSTTYTEGDKPSVTAALDVDYPDSGDPLMVRSVKQWIGGQLGLTDTTAMAGSDSFAEAFFKKYETGKEMLKNHPNGYAYRITVRKVDETAAYVSFTISTETFEGKKESTTHIGATFIKPTGKIFGYDMFSADHPRSLAVLVMQGLMESHEADDFQQLTRYISPKSFSPMDQGVNKLPETSPWIEGDKVVFQYSEGELQDHSLSHPQARVPLSKAQKFFSPDFQRALEEAIK